MIPACFFVKAENGEGFWTDQDTSMEDQREEALALISTADVLRIYAVVGNSIEDVSHAMAKAWLECDEPRKVFDNYGNDCLEGDFPDFIRDFAIEQLRELMRNTKEEANAEKDASAHYRGSVL